eukprot:12887117-Alexandrium_andersonii.AAC.1
MKGAGAVRGRPCVATPPSSVATRSFSTSLSTAISASMKANWECASSATIWGASTTRNERRPMRPFAPTLWASQS